MMVVTISVQTMASLMPAKATSWLTRAPKSESYPAWASDDEMRPVCFALAPTLTRISTCPLRGDSHRRGYLNDHPG